MITHAQVLNHISFSDEVDKELVSVYAKQQEKREKIKDRIIENYKDIIKCFEEDMKKIEQLIGGYLAGRDISANDLIVEILEIAEDY